MLQYVIAGLALGGIYAIASAGLVVTYQSAGVLNFAFGALAYFVARFFYFLHSQHGWGIPEAAVVSLLLVAPGLGIFLYGVVFRLLRLSSPLIKVVATLGLSVTIPPLAIVLFGNESILKAPGLAPEPVHVFHVAGVVVTMDQVIVYGCVILVGAVGALVLRYSDLGLRVRAMVDSPAMTSLSGTNPTAVSVGVWAVSTFLAGLAGVLSAPTIGLDPTNYIQLMAAAFAAVVAAKLRNLPVAILVGLAMGILNALVQDYMPPASSLTTAVLDSIPFGVTAIFLVYYIIRTGRVSESEGVGGALDRAIAIQGDERSGGATVDPERAGTRPLSWRPALAGVALVALLPFILHGFWVGLVAQGVAFGVLFLSFSLLTGDGGMVWLCVATFGGIGALTAGQLAANHGWPVLLAVLAGGAAAAPFGVLIGLLTIRLGDLYVALVTLTFGLLMETLVFSRQTFLNNGLGLTLNRPHFANGDRAFTYLCLAVFALIGLFIVNLRRSTTGMALTAVRWSDPASKTIGISVLQIKVLVAGLAAFVAGIGGALWAMELGAAQPNNYATFIGVIWLAVLVTQGIRSNTAALVAGISFTLLPGVTQAYAADLPSWFGNMPPILFGLGAIAVAKNPDGVVAMQARQIRGLLERLRSGRRAPDGAELSPTLTAGVHR